MTSLATIERLMRYGMCSTHQIAQNGCATCQQSLESIAAVRELVAAGRDFLVKWEACRAAVDRIAPGDSREIRDEDVLAGLEAATASRTAEKRFRSALEALEPPP